MNIEGHTSRAYDGDLAALQLRVLEMGGLVLEQVRAAAAAFTDWNADAARLVVDRDRDVDAYNEAIDEAAQSLIARRQPVAGDLRAIIAMLKAVASIERAGSEASKVAGTVLRSRATTSGPAAREARHLGKLAQSLFRDALDAFDRLDSGAAGEVIRRDRDLDLEYAAALRRLLTHAMQDPRRVESTVEAAFVLKAFERVGDAARNVARRVVAMAAGGPHSPLPGPGARSVAAVTQRSEGTG